MKKNILFLHNAFPSQFEKLVIALEETGKYNITALFTGEWGIGRAPYYPIKNVNLLKYTIGNKDVQSNAFGYLKPFDLHVMKGHDVWRILKEQFKEGKFTKPDLVYMHSGWGDGLFIKDLFQNVPIISYSEFYYGLWNKGTEFEKHDPIYSLEDVALQCRMLNANNLFNLESCDYAISPTNYQKERHPRIFWEKIKVLYDGVDATKLRAHKVKPYVTPNGKVLYPGSKILTYGAPSLEPMRGFPQAMETFGKLLDQHEDVEIVVYGVDGVSYGNKQTAEVHTSQKLLNEFVKPEHHERIHFVGLLTYADFLNMLHLSRTHLYMTVPFVLSWSFMEAMAIGCAVVGSKSGPVEEMIVHEKNGLLASFFETDEIAKEIIRALDDDKLNETIRKGAKELVDKNYDISIVMPEHLRWIEKILDTHTVSDAKVSQVA